MVRILLPDASPPPFGSGVYNARGQETGIIGEDGLVYLTGMQVGDLMSVQWDGKAQCDFALTEQVNADDPQAQFVCRPLAAREIQSPSNP